MHIAIKHYIHGNLRKNWADFIFVWPRALQCTVVNKLAATLLDDSQITYSNVEPKNRYKIIMHHSDWTPLVFFAGDVSELDATINRGGQLLQPGGGRSSCSSGSGSSQQQFQCNNHTYNFTGNDLLAISKRCKKKTAYYYPYGNVFSGNMRGNLICGSVIA